MTIIRIKHQQNYTCIANAALKDKTLSYKARGILCYLLSFPDNWQVNTFHLCEGSDRDGATSIESGLRELKARGYFRKVPIRGEDGRIVRWETHLTESPADQIPTSPEFPKARSKKTHRVENQIMENPPSGKPGGIISNVLDQVSKEANTKRAKAHEKKSEPTLQPERIDPIPATPSDPEWDHVPSPLPDSLAKTDLLVEADMPPARRVDASVNTAPNPFDSYIVNGHQHRQQWRDRHAQQNGINPAVFADVPARDDFWQQAIARLMAENPKLSIGQAKAIASGYARQLNAGEATNPEAEQFYQLWQEGAMNRVPTATTATQARQTAAYAQFLNS